VLAPKSEPSQATSGLLSPQQRVGYSHPSNEWATLTSGNKWATLTSGNKWATLTSGNKWATLTSGNKWATLKGPAQ
jgi:hypothetical protein